MYVPLKIVLDKMHIFQNAKFMGVLKILLPSFFGIVYCYITLSEHKWRMAVYKSFVSLTGSHSSLT